MSREAKARRNLIFIFDNEHLENKSTPYLLLLLATEVLFKVERERELCFSFSFFLPLLFRPLNCIFLVSVRTRSSWNSSAHWFVHAMCSRLCTIQQISTRSRNLFWQHTPVDSPSREELASSSFLSFFFFFLMFLFILFCPDFFSPNSFIYLFI